MGLTGLWAQRAASDYTGATKWGTGVNPIHAIPDMGRGRVIGTRQNPYPLGEPSGEVPSEFVDRDVDWLPDDYAVTAIPGEVFRYQGEHPDWGEVTPQFRDDTNGVVMGEQPSWGVYHDDNPVDGFPLPGPTGGMARWLDVSHGENVERQHAIAVPAGAVTGGWLGKVRGEPSAPESQEVGQEGFQWTLNNASRQGPGKQSLVNDRAVARGTDGPRSPILSRVAGATQKMYARSFEMGGGSGTPSMTPYQHTPGLRRPWFTRTAATPPDELHSMNTMEGRSPMVRTVPADPYQGPESAGDVGVSDIGPDWGY